MATHVVYVRPTPVLNNVPLDKNNATQLQMLRADTQMRIVPNTEVPNSATSPTIEQYVKLEDSIGFRVIQLTNSVIITKQ